MRLPYTKYQMMWGGLWRPVTNMFSGRVETHDRSRATSVVLYLGPDDWLATVASSGEIFERDDYPDPEDAVWEEVD